MKWFHENFYGNPQSLMWPSTERIPYVMPGGTTATLFYIYTAGFENSGDACINAGATLPVYVAGENIENISGQIFSDPGFTVPYIPGDGEKWYAFTNEGNTQKVSALVSATGEMLTPPVVC